MSQPPSRRASTGQGAAPRPPARPGRLNDPQQLHQVLERLVGANQAARAPDKRPPRPVTWYAYPKVRRWRAVGRAEPACGWGLMKPALRRLKLDKMVESYLALRAFDLVYGGVVRHRARAERYARKILYIRAESSAWVQELSFLKEEILKKLNRTTGGLEIKDLRFTVGPINELPTWEAPPPAPLPEREPYAPDPRVAGALTQVSDDELRDCLAALYITACHAGR